MKTESLKPHNTIALDEHPSAMLQANWIETIKNNAAQAEEQGHLLPAQLQLAYQQNWFKMLVPFEYGGLQLSLPEEVRLIEAIAWADGSMGWDVTLCTGAGWFGGFLVPDFAREIFANPEVCLAGSGAPDGTAEIIEGGYRVNGVWNYASGAMHASIFTANCRITREGKPVLDDAGQPLILPFAFYRHQVNILPAWNYIGMIATGSHSFEVVNQQVSAQQCFKIDAASATHTGLLYQYPFLQLAEATLAANMAGVAIHFLDLCGSIFEERKQTRAKLTEANKQQLDVLYSNALANMDSLRGSFYEVLQQSWDDFAAGDTAKIDASLKAVTKYSRLLAKTARTVVDELYPYCGLIAASKGTEINRVWRDMHTASQHALLTFSA